MSLPASPSKAERRHLLDKLLRELQRADARSLEHARRLARKIGEAEPVAALRDVAMHTLAMRPRFLQVLRGHDLLAERAGGFSSLSALRQMVVIEHRGEPARTFRAALHEIRHGVEIARTVRELARLDELFGLVRWCDDWLAARRALLARVEAQQAWFAAPPALPAPAQPGDDARPLPP